MPEAAIECPSCKTAIAVSDFVSACSQFQSSLNVVRFTCPACSETTDARIENSRISLGYVYAAGAPHFCGMLDVPVRGLAAFQNGTDLTVELAGSTWSVRSALGRAC